MPPAPWPSAPGPDTAASWSGRTNSTSSPVRAARSNLGVVAKYSIASNTVTKLADLDGSEGLALGRATAASSTTPAFDRRFDGRSYLYYLASHAGGMYNRGTDPPRAPAPHLDLAALHAATGAVPTSDAAASTWTGGYSRPFSMWKSRDLAPATDPWTVPSPPATHGADARFSVDPAAQDRILPRRGQPVMPLRLPAYPSIWGAPGADSFSDSPAFTLIELLVVIAVLGESWPPCSFPHWARARDAAHRARCLSNLRQLAIRVPPLQRGPRQPPARPPRCSAGPTTACAHRPAQPAPPLPVRYCPTNRSGCARPAAKTLATERRQLRLVPRPERHRTRRQHRRLRPDVPKTFVVWDNYSYTLPSVFGVAGNHRRPIRRHPPQLFYFSAQFQPPP
jgi:hypothetical protein